MFDVEDLKARTHELADFVEAASREYGFDAIIVRSATKLDAATIDAVRNAVPSARERLFIGGKSMGGRAAIEIGPSPTTLGRGRFR